MSQRSSDAASAYRRKVRSKYILFVILISAIWLQPKIQIWLDGHKAGESEGSGQVVIHDAEPSTTTRFPAEHSGVIRDGDKTPVAEIDRSEPVLGKLREIQTNVFESTAGLRYVAGSADAHRLRHVMQHAKDDITKPIHGVFDGNRDQILAVIDEAFQKAEKAGGDVRSEKQNNRCIYTVNLGRKIGFMGGSEGARQGHPACHYLRIILEDGDVVISAYPTKNF